MGYINYQGKIYYVPDNSKTQKNKLGVVFVGVVLVITIALALVIGGNFSSTVSKNTLTLNSNTSALDRVIKTVRLDSALRSQYNSDFQWRNWSYASCSGCSLAELMNTYGARLKCADPLQVEYELGLWDPRNGLGGNAAWMQLGRVTKQFGFKAVLGKMDINYDSVNQLIKWGNSGRPIMIGLGSHILDIVGGDYAGTSGNLVLIDSNSGGNRVYSSITKSQFISGFPGNNRLFWTGMYLYVIPV